MKWLSVLVFFLVLGCVQKGGDEMNLTGKKVVMIIAPENFRDEELMRPKEILQGYGAKVVIASKGVEVATGMLGASVPVDLDISDVNVDDYDAVIFVGGSGASTYFNDTTAHEIAKTAYEKGKVIGAICIAPSTLANAGVLNGKRATSWPSERKNLESKGATYVEQPVVVDGRIVTANGPSAASEFGKKIAELLGS